MKLPRASGLLLVLIAAGCARPAPPSESREAVLRIGVSSGRMSVSTPDAGLAMVKQNITVESLASFSDDGRPRPAVAEGWTVSDDRRLVTIRLRPNVLYQDGTPLTAADVAATLNRRLPRDMGPAYDDIDAIQVVNDREVAIKFKRPSGFRTELLEVTVQKPGSHPVGTGPYKDGPAGSNELQANDQYYLGKPAIGRIRVEAYPSFRSAWADMLRDRNDMLFEVGVDALESLQNATRTARIFAFTRRYQYLVLLNPERPLLKSPATRQALNLAIDRDGLIRDALSGHGEVSIGPVSAKNWAMAGLDAPRLASNPTQAAAMIRALPAHLRFKCLVLPDYERIALVVKRQLEAVGVEMELEMTPADQLLARLSKGDFDACMLDGISGPTLYRLYRFWHSGETLNPMRVANPGIDAALDEVRHSSTDEEYRQGVAAFIKAVLKDPPAIFLAWSQAARAVSTRFIVPEEPGRPDPIATLRLWKPANAAAASSRN